MKKIINLIASLSLLILISPVSQAASCTLSDVTANGVDANKCSVHDGNNDSYINDINTVFDLSNTWQEFKIEIPKEYVSPTTDNGIVISGDLTDGIWTFYGALTDPFVIVLKTSTNFAAYLFEDYQNVNGGTGTFEMIFKNDNSVAYDLSHFSIYTTVSNVPLPAALWLFAPALLGFMGLRKKTKS